MPDDKWRERDPEDDDPDEEEDGEEPVPEGLQEKWLAEEKKGRSAGVCRSCGNLYSDEDLFCRHCGERTRMPSGVIGDLEDLFARSGWRYLLAAILLAALIAFLVL